MGSSYEQSETTCRDVGLIYIFKYILEILDSKAGKGLVYMKKEYVFGLLAFFFMSLCTVAITYAVESETVKEKVIHEYNMDVTGDKKNDHIVLKGIQIDPSSAYMKKIWAEITTSANTKYRIDYAPGYEPKIEFADLNHDGVVDLFQSSATGGSGGLNNYHLSTLKDGTASILPLPHSLNIQGHFENNFKASIQIPETQFTKTVDLSNRKKDYIRLGLYQKNGELNEPTELMIDPVAMYKIIKLNGTKEVGLKAYRQISGAYHADVLGTVTSIWNFENGTWKLKSAKWKQQ
ncbi:hypothetical protein BLX88_09805 [Bacillus obstructivus]|nr:hypothetical protein BLX88_09805 [Bacillus obstructivus]